MKNKKKLMQWMFAAAMAMSSLYVLFIRSELYESWTEVSVKDLSSKGLSASSFSFLLPASGNAKDDYAIMTYLASYEELEKLDKKFHLLNHYKSNALDPLQRLYSWSTKEDFLELYQKRLIMSYDEIKGLLSISFLHTDPKTSYAVVKQMLADANEKINEYNKLMAKKQLDFTKKQVEVLKKKLDESIEKVKEFQNKYVLLDPTQTAETEFAIVANLKALLVEKEGKLQELSAYMNKDNFEIIRLQREIEQIKQTLEKMRKSLTNPKKDALNVYIFEFERLKGFVEINKELYKQALLQLEQLKQEIHKNSKMLLVLTEPFVPDGYKYPEKFKDVITIILILSMLYGILSLIGMIIKEHMD